MTIRFFLFLVVQAISSLGSSAASEGLKVIWEKAHWSPDQLSQILAIPALAMLVVGPLVGALLEGARLKRLLVVTNLFLGAVSLGIWLVMGRPSIAPPYWWLLGLFLLKEVGSSAFGGGYNRAFKGLVVVAERDGASAIQSGVNNLGMAGGAALGAWMAAAVGALVFALDAATFGIAAVLVALLPLGSTAAAEAEAPAPASWPGPRQIVADLWEAISHVRNQPRLVRVAALFVPLTLAYSLWDIATVFLLPSLGVGAEALGWVMLAFLAAEIATAAIIHRTQTRFTVRLVMVSTLVLALTTGAVGLLGKGGFVLLLALRALSGITSFTAGGGVWKLLVIDSPDSMTAKMAALVTSLGLGVVFGVSRLLVGHATTIAGPSATFGWIGLLAAAIALTIGLLEVSARRGSGE